jgi:hypothetical protein
MQPQERASFISAYSKVLTSAWTDPKYLAELKANPKEALDKAGLTTPANAQVHLVTQQLGAGSLDSQIAMWTAGVSTGHYQLVVPEHPQLSEANLKALTHGQAGAADTNACCCCCPCCSCT